MEVFMKKSLVFIVATGILIFSSNVYAQRQKIGKRLSPPKQAQHATTIVVHSENHGLDRMLIEAVANPDISMAIIKVLINEGADVNAIEEAKGATVFLFAANRFNASDIGLLDFLAKKGADTHAIDNDGRNAFFYPLVDGQRGNVENLLKLGVNINVKDKKGLTPLKYYKIDPKKRDGGYFADTEFVELLVEKYGAVE
jgi:ankyrin repeat protein